MKDHDDVLLCTRRAQPFLGKETLKKQELWQISGLLGLTTILCASLKVFSLPVPEWCLLWFFIGATAASILQQQTCKMGHCGYDNYIYACKHGSGGINGKNSVTCAGDMLVRQSILCTNQHHFHAV